MSYLAFNIAVFMTNSVDKKKYVNTIQVDDGCDFCAEVRGLAHSTFNRIYATTLKDRTIEDSDNFVALPTLGQLFQGSVLILPKLHFKTFAGIPDYLRPEAARLIKRVSTRVSVYGNVIIFEHGAYPHSGGGCGIYHAHIHVVPVPSGLLHSELMLSRGRCSKSLSHAWNATKNLSEYLVIRDTSGSVAWYTTQSPQHSFGSQYLRQRLVEHYQLNRPWNWRHYNAIEPDLIATYRRLRTFRGTMTKKCTPQWLTLF